MKKSDGRILTTHAGSLPRPQKLTALHARKFAGERIDEAELARETAAAVDGVIRQRAEAGIDIGNNGEAPRESFFASSAPILKQINEPTFPSTADRMSSSSWCKCWFAASGRRVEFVPRGSVSKEETGHVWISVIDTSAIARVSRIARVTGITGISDIAEIA